MPEMVHDDMIDVDWEHTLQPGNSTVLVLSLALATQV